jgi:DNA-binding beta-propeller fold protein YncE
VAAATCAALVCSLGGVTAATVSAAVDPATPTGDAAVVLSVSRPLQPVDSGPAGIAVDPTSHTVYVTGGYSQGSLSVFTGSS